MTNISTYFIQEVKNKKPFFKRRSEECTCDVGKRKLMYNFENLLICITCHESFKVNGKEVYKKRERRYVSLNYEI